MSLYCTGGRWGRVTDPRAADLGSGHWRERVGGSEDGLVVQHWLVGHHRHAAHLTHLGGDLGRRTDVFRTRKRRPGGGLLPYSPFRTQALVVCSWEKPWESEPGGRAGET